MSDRWMDEQSVTIRPISEEDTDLVIKWRNNLRVRGHFVFRERFTRDLHENWLKEKVGRGLVIQYIICIGEECDPVGSVYFSNVKKDSAEYGIFIGEDSAVGRGVGTKAGRLLLKEGFERYGFREIFLRVFTDNLAAIKSYEKLGFKTSETLKEVECSNGEKKDMYLMIITRERYDQL